MARHLPYFLASFTWNYGLGMTWLAVPLFAHAQGLSGAELGILFSIPSIAQLAINLVGGAYVDRVGIVTGFYVLGVLSLVVVGFVALLRGWAFARTRLGAKGGARAAAA